MARERADGTMEIDPATRRNLELVRGLDGRRDGSLLATIDRTLTGPGARLLAERIAAPLTERAEIERRLDLVQLFVERPAVRQRVREALRRTPDIERALQRLSVGRGGPRDLLALRDGLESGEALAETLSGKNALLVASTDLSHFHNQETANTLDAAMLAQVEAFSPEGVFEIEARGDGEACGLGALAAVLWAAKNLGADRVKVLYHATSGDVTGDNLRVVGYGAAAVLKARP